MVLLLVTMLPDDRFYPAASEFCRQSPCCYMSYLRQDTPAGIESSPLLVTVLA